jgi:hypothetical protein
MLKIFLKLSYQKLKNGNYQKFIGDHEEYLNSYKSKLRKLKLKYKIANTEEDKEEYLPIINDYTLYIKEEKEYINFYKKLEELKDKDYNFFEILRKELYKMKMKYFTYWPEEVNKYFTWEKNENIN